MSTRPTLWALIATSALTLPLTSAATPDSGADAVRERLLEQYPKLSLESIKPAAMEDWFRVRSAGSPVFVDRQAQYMLRGDLTDLLAQRKRRQSDGYMTDPVEPDGQDAVHHDDPEALQAALAERFPSAPVDTVDEAPAPGWFRARSGRDIAYVHDTARFVLRGDLVDLQAGKNLTAAHKREARLTLLNEIPPDSFITYAPEGEPRATITVFADTSCPYCQRYHAVLMELVNEHGVKVRYAMYPRRGTRSSAAATLRRVWCSDDPQRALPAAYVGKKVDANTCSTVLEQHFEVAQAIKIPGTPTTITGDGTMIAGARPVQTVLNQIGLEVADTRTTD